MPPSRFSPHGFSPVVLGLSLACIPALTGCESCDSDANIYANAGDPLPFIDEEDRAAFIRGKEVFEHQFTPSEGGGPDFNAVSCVACHSRPVNGGAGPLYRNFQLIARDNADGGQDPVFRSLVMTIYNVDRTKFTPTPQGLGTIHAAQRNAPSMFGTGLLELVEDREILSREDPDDTNGDGISGRANLIDGLVGRFGVKSQAVNLEQFNRGAFFNQMGITTDPLFGGSPIDKYADTPESRLVAAWNTFSRSVMPTAYAQVSASQDPLVDDDAVADPELSSEKLIDLSLFNRLLAVPFPPAPTADFETGQELFAEIGCQSCHTATLRSPVGLIHPYTDLLIHDMGPDLDDGLIIGEASGSEFRTAPLWAARFNAPYMHDGRADTLVDAINAHGGEGESSKQKFNALDEASQQAVIHFVEGL